MLIVGSHQRIRSIERIQGTLTCTLIRVCRLYIRRIIPLARRTTIASSLLQASNNVCLLCLEVESRRRILAEFVVGPFTIKREQSFEESPSHQEVYFRYVIHTTYVYAYTNILKLQVATRKYIYTVFLTRY